MQKTTEDIQRVLGSQGVGLSSLIAIGGSQVSGALGFYSTLWLLNNLPESKSDRFIIPTDVCNQYLESLARDSDKSRTTKRSDLTLIDLSDDALTFTAIEIKFYGVSSQSPDSNMERVDGQGVLKAAEQAAYSTGLLRKIQTNWQNSKNKRAESDRYILANALASLVEAGAKLKPGLLPDRQQTLRRLEKMLSNIQINIGKPIIAYFTTQM